MPLRIAVTLTQCWHPVPGGTATAALHLVRALAARDDVELIGVGPRVSGPAPEPFAPPVPVRHLRLPYHLLYEAWHRGLEAPERVTGPVDVVHSTVPMCPPTRTAPLVATVHDLFPLLEPGTLTRRGVRMMTTAFDLMRRRASIVTCSSQQTLDDCIAHGFDPDRLRLVPLGATAVEVSADQRREVRRRHRLDQRYLLWVGTIEPRKNLPLLIEAHRRAAVDDLELVIVGPAGWNTELSAMLGRDHPGIRALGFVPDHDLAVLMAGAEALMFPSRREGFGLPAVEAMAQGTPVVGSAGTAIAEVVGDSGRLLDHRDLDGWIDTITEIAGDAEWKPPRQAAARRRAANFTWELTAEATMAAYRDAITDPRPRKSAWK